MGFPLIRFEDAVINLDPFTRVHPYETKDFIINDILKHFQEVSFGVVLGGWKHKQNASFSSLGILVTETLLPTAQLNISALTIVLWGQVTAHEVHAHHENTQTVPLTYKLLVLFLRTSLRTFH